MTIKFRDKNSLEVRLEALLQEFAKQHKNEDGYTMLFVTPETHIEVKIKKPSPNRPSGLNIIECVLDEYYTDVEPIDQIKEFMRRIPHD